MGLLVLGLCIDYKYDHPWRTVKKKGGAQKKKRCLGGREKKIGDEVERGRR